MEQFADRLSVMDSAHRLRSRLEEVGATVPLLLVTFDEGTTQCLVRVQLVGIVTFKLTVSVKL